MPPLPPNFNQELFNAALAQQGIAQGFGDAGQLEDPMAVVQGPYGAEVPAAAVSAPVAQPLPQSLGGYEEAAQLQEPAPPLLLSPPGETVQPQALPTDGLPALQDAPYEDRVGRDLGMVGTYGGRQQLRAEGIESGTDLGRISAEKTYDANTADALAEGTYYADAQVLHTDGAKKASEAARAYDDRIAQVRQRGAQIREELDNFQMDPDRVFRNRTTLGTIADTIAVGLGALAQYSTGRNVALDLIRKRVEDDMTSQAMRQKQLVGQYNRMPDEIESIRGLYDNDVAKDSIERAYKYKAIEDKLSEQLARSKGTRAEAGLAQALFEVNRWRMGELDKAERAAEHQEAQNLKLEIAMMKKAGAGPKPAGDTLPGKIKPVTGQFVLRDPSNPKDPGEVYYPSIDELTSANQDKYRERMEGAQKTLDHVGTLQQMDLSFKAYGEEKALAAQQAANLTLAGFKALPGVETDKDALEIMKASGLGNGTVDGLKQTFLNGGADAALVMLEESAQRAQIEATDLLNTVPRPDGRRITWEGAERRASKPVIGRIRELGKDPKQRSEEKVAATVKALEDGTADNPEEFKPDPKMQPTDIIRLRIAAENWLNANPQAPAEKREQWQRTIALLQSRIDQTNSQEKLARERKKAQPRTRGVAGGLGGPF
jgi:hypothetical protein